MNEYVWKGVGTGERHAHGVMAADSKSAVVTALRRQHIRVTSVRQKGREVLVPRLRRGVSARELALFTRQFSVMIDAGLPLVQCLDILASQQDNRALQAVVTRVRADVEGGATLSESLARHPSVFDDLYCNMIAAGEAGGILDVILQRLARHIEKAVRLRRAVRSALAYPCAVVAIAVLVVTVILWKVIPTFEQLFAGLGAQLPYPTRLTIAASQIVGRYGIWMVLTALLVAAAVRAAHRTYTGRRVIDRGLLLLFVIGDLLRKVAVARFCRTLATLVSSGVPILDGMEITARTAGNAIIEDAVMLARRGVEEGKTLAEPLAETGVFPPMVTHMIAVGEQTGALDAMLAKIADFYEEEVDAAIEQLLSLLEPVMILFLGVTIGAIVISMYLPMFDMLIKVG